MMQRFAKQLRANWRTSLAGLAFGLTALILAVSQVNFSSLSADLAAVQYAYLLPAGLVLLVGLALRAARWRALLADDLPLTDSFSIVSIGYLLNSLLPLRAGEVARVMLAGRAGIPAFRSASTIVVERSFDLLALLVLVALLLAAAPLPPEIRAAAAAVAPTALILVAVVAALAYRRALAETLLARLSARSALARRLQLETRVQQVLDGFSPLASPGRLLRVLALTALGWSSTVFSVIVLSYAFFGGFALTTAMLVIAALSLAVAVPALPGSIGTFELSVILALNAAGYGSPSNTALAFSIILHLLDLSAYVVASLYGFLQQGISPARLSENL